MNWERVLFEQAPFVIIDGDRGKNYPKKGDLLHDGYCLFLNTRNVTKNGFVFSDCQFVSEDRDLLLRKGKLQRDDIVLTTRGTIGNIGHYSENIPFENVRINSGMVILRCDALKIFPEFLYAFLQSKDFSDQVERLRSGAAQPQLPIRDLKKADIPLPSIDEQRMLVSAYLPYSDLIATNERRIQLLEEAARRLYREWFVHLRFPGYEEVSVVDRIPEGWGKLQLSNVVKVNGQSFKATELPENLNYIDISSVSPGLISYKSKLSASKAPGRARRKVKHGDIIWSCVRPNRRSYALIWEPEENDVASTGFAVLSAESVLFSYLYFVVTSDEFVTYLEANATGAAYPAVTAKTFQNAEIVQPSDVVMRAFDDKVKPILELCETLKLQNNRLKQARDQLLPKLMSGQLDISRIKTEPLIAEAG